MAISLGDDADDTRTVSTDTLIAFADMLETSAAIAIAASRYERGTSPSDTVNLEGLEDEGDGTRIVTVPVMSSDTPLLSASTANKHDRLCSLCIGGVVCDEANG